MFTSATWERLVTDTTTAMKARDSFTTTTLRLVKSAIQNKAIEKRASLDEGEVQSILATMLKQRKDSIEQFTAGGRQDLAEKEAAEIKILEAYMPHEIGPDALRIMVQQTIEHHSAESGIKATKKDMGTVIKKVRSSLEINGLRAEGSAISSLVKGALA